MNLKLKTCKPTSPIGFTTSPFSFFVSHRRRNCWNARHVSTRRVWPGWLCCWCSGARAGAAPAGENHWWRRGHWSSFFRGSQQWIQPCKEDCGKVIIWFLFSGWCLWLSDIRYYLPCSFLHYNLNCWTCKYHNCFVCAFAFVSFLRH